MLRFTIRAAALGIVLTLVQSAGTGLFAASPIPLSSGVSNVFQFELAADGSRVVFSGISQATTQLFSAPVTAESLPTRLNGTLTLGGFVQDWELSPDGARVLYRANQFTVGVDELFLVPTTGGFAQRVNSPLVAGGDVWFEYSFSADGSHIVYIADQQTDEVREVFAAQIVDGFADTAVKVSGTMVAGGDAEFAILSPDGLQVIYHADQQLDERLELFTVPSVGGFPAVKLNPTPPLGGSVDFDEPRLSPDGTRVIYRGDILNDEVQELFSVPIGGGPSTRLNGQLVAGGNVDSEDLSFSPDGSKILYLADQITDGVEELFIVPITGGTPIKLSGPMVAGGDVADDGTGQFTPDGSRVVYVADQHVDGVDELFSVPSTGGMAIKLNGPMVAGGEVDDDSIQISPDGAHVLYVADQLTDGVKELFIVPTAGGTPLKLNQPLLAGTTLEDDAEFSPDGSRIVYPVDDETSSRRELYLVPSTGGTPVKINGPLGPEGTVDFTDPEFTPDGNRIIFLAQQEFDTGFQVYARVLRNRPLLGGGDWDENETWVQQVSPDEIMQIVLDTAATVVADGSFENRVVNELRVGGGPSASTLVLDDDAAIAALNGITIAGRGVIRGDGRIVGSLQGPSLGELRALAGDQLHFSSSNFTNSGVISALGSDASLAEVELDGAVVNSAGVGLIAGQSSVFRFGEGITNEGSILLSSGSNSVFGDIDNSGGRIAVSGGASATFFDDVIQNGTLQVLKVGSTNSVATFAGAFTGSNGSSGGGDIFFLGDMRPGASPALVTFGNNVSFGSSAVLEIELGGTSAGTEYDRMNVMGELALDGLLRVTLIDDFIPSAGSTFDVLDWTTLTGTFASIELPALGTGLAWDTTNLYTAGVVSVVLDAGLPGDFNVDGSVDAADYVAWRKIDGTPEGYNAWRANFGQTLGGGSAGASPSQAAVPEPATAALALLASILLFNHRGHESALLRHCQPQSYFERRRGLRRRSKLVWGELRNEKVDCD